MSTLQMQNLLGYINGLSLSMSNRRWLAEHLIMPAETAETPNQQYVRETLTRALVETKQAIAEGRSLQSVDDFLAEFEAERI